jgi:hypothetical protein
MVQADTGWFLRFSVRPYSCGPYETRERAEEVGYHLATSYRPSQLMAKNRFGDWEIQAAYGSGATS